jgi:hypothetical protein
MHSLLYKVTKTIKGDQVIIDHPSRSFPRYGHGNPPHARLYEIINRNRITYESTLRGFLRFKDNLLEIPVRNENSSQEPCWINGNLPGLDSVALYSFLCLNRPKRFFEIGSGYSTKFARKAILDHNLTTKITSGCLPFFLDLSTTQNMLSL